MIGIMSGSLDACAVYYTKQLQKTSYHEAGHAVIGYDLKLYNIQLASIIPDQKSLGRVQCGNYTRKLSKDDLKGLIRMNLAGYVAEQEFNFVQNGLIENFDEGFNILFVQAKKSSDLNEAIDIAQKLVKYFYNIDPEINKQEFGMKLEQILRKCYQQTVEEVNDKRCDIESIAERLLEKDIISGREIAVVIMQNRSYHRNDIIQQIKSPHKVIVAKYV